MAERKKAFNPTRSVNSKLPGVINLWSAVMTARSGEEITVVGSTESEIHCWQLLFMWKRANKNSSFWNWEINPKLVRKSWLNISIN
ncbi:MAG TPA: hypothetical protein PKI14_12110 [Fervidobacterium sp.]|nr:hypothetical protein [Fervidobacterium sp.]